MEDNLHKLGIDIGSTTAKVVVINPQGEILFSDYRRHKAATLTTLRQILLECQSSLGDQVLSVLVTGSAGLGVSEKYDLPFIQEVVASAEVVQQRYPAVKTLIDIGGEDAKMIFFNEGGAPEIRMNGSCAGGTGAFIDEMATFLNVDVSELNELADRHEIIYPMASRCGVFAKTDLQNLLSREVSHEDIAASVFHAVVLQTLATLARGNDPSPQILFGGGPLTFLPALKTAFLQELNLSKTDALETDHTELLPALGAALASHDQAGRFSTQELLDHLERQIQFKPEHKRRLEPLFNDRNHWQGWEKARMQRQTERVSPLQAAGQNCFLGVDSGSTTSKIVLIDEGGRLVFDYYCSNRGNAIQAVRQGLQKLQKSFEEVEQTPKIARSVVTGYGEDLIRAAFGFDDGLVETLAHFRAARAFDEQVSFILDIGGQDMKAIYVQDGYIRDIQINEACSSGCGSFIESFAGSMGYTVGNFASQACQSESPCDLGSRCTVFMNSRVKQALREAAAVGDISAGLAYSVIKNALHKVLKISDMSVLGQNIIVQGGAFRNPAIHKAMENLVGRDVVCPDIAELMGAYGAALTARDAYHEITIKENGSYDSSFLGLKNLELAGSYHKKLIHCRGCENRCAVTKLVFANENIFYTGNRCENIYTNRGVKVDKGESLYAKKYDLLFDRPVEPDGSPLQTIGIPRVLNIYENFPFWSALLVGCGFKVQLSDPSDNSLFKKGTGSVMSENICFPAKLVHGHIYNLIDKGVDRIFYPMVFFEGPEFSDADNCFNCPIVSGYPDVVQSAIDPEGEYGIPLDKPAVSFQDIQLLRKAAYEYLSKLGVSKRKFKRAFRSAVAAQIEYKKNVRALGAQMLDRSRQEDRQVILLMGRPYHIDPLINHNAPEILAEFGIDVISEDAIPLPPDQPLDNKHVLTQWEFLNRYYNAANWANQQDDIEVVQLNNFACGPDAYTIDEVKSILSSYGKSHTIIRIDEIESTGSTRLRLRSLIEALKANEMPGRSFTPRKKVKLFEESDRHKRILAPYFSRFCAPTVSGPLLSMDYLVETLPPSDRESVEIGLRYTNNEICYPGIIVIGDIIKALQSGKYDPEQVAAGSWITGGQCRASSILSLLKRALIAAGYENVPVVALTTDKNLHEQPGMELNLVKYIHRALLASIYSDSISAMYHSTAVREVTKGEAKALADELLAPLEKGLLPLTRSDILDGLSRAVNRFNKIVTRERNLPKVGIVGEIYVKFNSFVNNQVTQWMMDQEIEVVVPPLLEFFASWFVNADERVRNNLRQKDLLWVLANVVERYVDGFLNKTEAVMQGFKYYHPSHSIRDVANKARDIVALTHHYGEGWLIAGEIGEFVKNGVQNVLCLQPFGCIANQVVARGVSKRLKQKYNDLNLLFLDLDAGVSEVNFFNRMYFFINHARQTKMIGEAQSPTR